VLRESDWIMYSVEAEFIEEVVQEYGPRKYIDLSHTTEAKSDMIQATKLPPNRHLSRSLKRRLSIIFARG
jgi:hypothetical protein